MPARTVVLPATIEAYALHSSGEREEQATRAKALEETIGAEFERRARAKGALPLSFDKVRTCGDSCVSQLSTAIRWGAKAAMEIGQATSGVNPGGKSSVDHWRNGRDFRPLQNAVGADFALVFFVRDAQVSGLQQFWDARPDQKVIKAAHKDDTDLKRMLVACALELGTGRMVWCSSIVDRWTDQYVDLTAPAEYRRLVNELLTGF